MATKRRTPETLDMLLMSLLATSGEMSGYEIASILREPVPLIWPVKHSQIYPALARLEQTGSIDGQWIEQQGRPDKKSYTLSVSGTERLTRWLLEEGESYSDDQIILIVYNIALIGEGKVTAALSRYRRQCEEELRLLENRWARAIRFGAERGHRLDLGDAKWIGVRASYEFAISARASRLTWCDTVLERSEAVIAVAMVRDHARQESAAKTAP